MASNQKLTPILAGRVVKAIRQTGAALDIDFADGSTVHIKLAEATSSVMVRDNEGKMEYAD